jgi:hypothetical protein
MTFMLCRNRVADFAQWKSVFASHADAHRDAGLHLVKVWRALDDPKNVFFAFEVESLEKAQAFISNPEAAKAGQSPGVIEGEYHFVEDAGGY